VSSSGGAGSAAAAVDTVLSPSAVAQVPVVQSLLPEGSGSTLIKQQLDDDSHANDDSTSDEPPELIAIPHAATSPYKTRFKPSSIKTVSASALGHDSTRSSAPGAPSAGSKRKHDSDTAGGALTAKESPVLSKRFLRHQAKSPAGMAMVMPRACNWSVQAHVLIWLIRSHTVSSVSRSGKTHSIPAPVVMSFQLLQLIALG